MKKEKPKDKHAKFKDKWIKLCDDWLTLLWCSDFYVTYEFEDVGDSDEEGWIALANVVTKPRYKDVLITANPEQLSSLRPALLSKHARHEVMHVVLSQYQEFTKDLIGWIPGKGRQDVFYSVQKDEIELLTTRLTQIVIALFKNSKDGPCCHKHEPKQKVPKAKRT